MICLVLLVVLGDAAYVCVINSPSILHVSASGGECICVGRRDLKDLESLVLELLLVIGACLLSTAAQLSL